MELALKTGWSETQVREILEKLKTEKTLEPSSNLAFKMIIPPWFLAWLPALAVLLFYLPVLNNGFIDWDDRDMITANPNIHSLGLASLAWMFSVNSIGIWIPLTFISFALNYGMGGLDPRVFHLTNVLFHASNTFLVFQVCKRVLDSGVINEEKDKEFLPKSLVLPTAFLAALLFGIHPLRVESVAWAAERKDVLYAFFYLLGLLVYLGKPSLTMTSSLGREGETSTSNIKSSYLDLSKLFILLGLYLLALMSKPMAVTLPLVFLILDFWPLKRLQTGFSKVLIEKIPFFILALLFSLVTRIEMGDMNAVNHNLTLPFRAAHVFHSFAFYLWKMIAPFQLVPIYPFPHIVDNIYYLKAALAALLVTCFSIGVFLYRKKYPYLAAAWLYYLITLTPVIGFVQVGSFAAGDRYTYLSCLGLFLPLSGLLTTFFSRRFMFFWIFCMVLGLVLGFATVRQIGVWKDQESVSACVTKAYPVETRDSEIRYGDDLSKEGKVDDALKHYQMAGDIPPPIAAPHERMGNAYMIKGRMDEAIEEFKEALEINNDSKEYPSSYLHNQLWTAYERSGQKKEASAEAQKFLKENPNESSADYEMGIVYFEEKEYSEAVNYLTLAVQLEPNNKFYSDTLASILSKAGKTK
jgi:protein O-mannosyl-transferase